MGIHDTGLKHKTGLKRRDALKLAAAAPLAAVLADPRLARAAAMGLSDVTISTAGGREVSAAFAAPASLSAAGTAPGLILIHEWWGLNDQIKAVAAEFAKLGYAALAVDLYDGEVGTTRDEARALMKAVDGDQAYGTLAAWNGWARGQDWSNGKLGTCGWCFGGGWSLNASLGAPVEATVVYYGNVAKTAEELAPLQSPVLGHFATEDQWINQEMVDGFSAAMAAAGKTLEAHWYEAQHAFANPTSARYDEADAKLAWERTTAFFEQHLAS